MSLRIAVITLFPEIISAYFQSGVISRAPGCGLDLELISLREFGQGPHQKVDDRPYGGGPGMVLRADVLKAALDKARQFCPQGVVVAFSPVGRRIEQQLFRSWMPQDGKIRELILLAGRYEGFDQRFLDKYVDDCWSLGDFVLSGGEIPALACLDGFARLLPGVLNTAESFEKESFGPVYFDHPHYTRPATFEGDGVPEILLSGHHENIEQWRLGQSALLKKKWRPDHD